MIDYARSSFTWKTHPWEPDPHYRWMGGFVGEPGQTYHVRFSLHATCTVEHDDGRRTEIFLGAPCRSEYTIADRNLFQVPSGEWRLVFSRTHTIPLAHSLDDLDVATPRRLEDAFADHTIDIRRTEPVTEHRDAGSTADATLANRLLGASTTYADPETGCRITLNYPVNVMNLNALDAEWQVCTGPVVVPAPREWVGDQIARVHIAHIALSSFDHAELIFRRPVEVTADVAEWLDVPRGRDRLELRDPANAPPGYPPPRPRPTVYHDVREFAAENVILSAP